MRRQRDVLTRFLLLVEIDPTTCCWLWQGYIDPRGYGSFRVASDRNANKAHRAAWELLRGPVPPGAVIDHLCRRRHCVNPAHLEPVTSQTNTDRGANARREMCTAALHEMSDDNVLRNGKGNRYCRACHADRERRRRAARKATAA